MLTGVASLLSFAINTVTPILAGVTIYSFYLAVMPMTTAQSTTIPIAPSPLVAFGHGLGLAAIFLSVAFPIFIIPAMVTSALAAALVSFLPTKSKILVFAVPFVLGSWAAALWLFYCTPARGGPFSEMVPCAIIGYLISGIVTCLLRTKISN